MEGQGEEKERSRAEEKAAAAEKAAAGEKLKRAHRQERPALPLRIPPKGTKLHAPRFQLGPPIQSVARKQERLHGKSNSLCAGVTQYMSVAGPAQHEGSWTWCKTDKKKPDPLMWAGPGV